MQHLSFDLARFTPWYFLGAYTASPNVCPILFSSYYPVYQKNLYAVAEKSYLI